MRVATGKVVSGKIVVDGEPFTEGSSVTVLAPENGEAFELSEADETALLAAIEEADRGDVIDGDQALSNLGKRA